NLVYRGLRLHRLPRIGDTLHTTKEVAGLKHNSAKPGRRPTGLAALRISTTDQQGATVLDFHRCAMLPLREDPAPGAPLHTDDLSALGPDTAPLRSAPAELDLAAYRSTVSGTHFDPSLVGT